MSRVVKSVHFQVYWWVLGNGYVGLNGEEEVLSKYLT